MTVLTWLIHLVLILFAAKILAGRETGLKKVFWSALVIKLFSGIAVGALYIYYYQAGDTIAYFEDASKLSSLARQHFWKYLTSLISGDPPQELKLALTTPRAFFMSSVVSIFTLLTGDSYWLTAAYFSFISFLAAWHLVKTLVRFIPSVTFAAIGAFLFAPSVVFWTSGLLKESLAMAALFYSSALFIKVWFDARLRPVEFGLALAALFVFWNLKYYYVAVFVPVVAAACIHKFFLREKVRHSPWLEACTFFALLTLPVVLVTFMHPNFSMNRILRVVFSNHAAYQALSGPGEVIAFENFGSTWGSLLLHAPWAIFSGLFRPLLWEASSPVQFIAATENTILLLLFVASLARLQRYAASPHRLLVLSVAVFVIALSVFLTLSAPNFGTLSRYRSGYLAFFVLIILSGNPVTDYLQRRFSRLVSK